MTLGVQRRHEHLDGTDRRHNDHWPPAWSADGGQLTYTAGGDTSTDGELVVLDLDTRRRTQLTDNDSPDLLVALR